jgi:hypothetical protein
MNENSNSVEQQTSLLMSVSPLQAKDWLDHNTRNRNLSLRAVSSLKDDILSGRWMTTHQGIAFYADGSLADGQHRLTAIAESGVTVSLQVTFGLPLDTILAIDQHRMRKTHDVIKLSQKADWIGKDEIAVLRCILGMKGTRKTTISVSEIIRLAEMIKPRLLFAKYLLDRGSVKGVTVAPVASAIGLALGYETEERLKLFADVLKTGVMSCDDDVAAIRLRETLINLPTGGGDSERRVVMLRTQKAIKLFCERRAIKKLYAPSEWIYQFPKELENTKQGVE